MRLRTASALALLALLAACGRGAGDNETAAPNGAVIAPDNETNVARAPEEEKAVPVVPPEAPLDELAGVQVGMTMKDLRAAGFDAVKDNGPDPDNRCGYARIASRKDLFFMLDGDTVVRIEVDTPGHPTIGGVDIGMSEAQAVRRLGARVKVQPHPYTGPTGHYLVVHEAHAPFGFIAETDGKKVVSYRIGRWAYVRWKEGCS
jgi:hypothetical protein